MQIGGDGVGAPEDDQARLIEALHVHAQRGADGRLVASRPGGGADGAVEARGTEAVEEAPVHRAEAELAGIAGVAIGQDALGAVRVGQLAQTIGDLVQCLIPGDAFETRLRALGADAAQRIQEPIG